MNKITLITTEQRGHQSTMEVPESCVDYGSPEGDATVITVTLRPSDLLNGMRQNQDPMQLVLRKLQEAGAPVEETPNMRFLRTGILRRYDAFPDIKYEWRSK